MNDKNDILDSGNKLPPKPAKTGPGGLLAEDGGLPELDEKRLTEYISGELSAEEQNEIEKWVAEEGMESDAIEGLKMMNASATRASVKKLNRRLAKTIKEKKNRRNRTLPNSNVIVAVAVIMLLIIAAYLVILYIKSHKH